MMTCQTTSGDEDNNNVNDTESIMIDCSTNKPTTNNHTYDPMVDTPDLKIINPYVPLHQKNEH